MESSVINPIFHENNSVSVVFSFDEEFCKYFSVTLQSIIDIANHYTNYDLVVLTSYISENSLQRLSSQLPENFSLRVINIKTFLDAHFPNITLEKVGRWPIEMYFRIFIPLIMRSYKKILYLDSDLITETDILTLFNQEFENKTEINNLQSQIDTNTATISDISQQVDLNASEIALLKQNGTGSSSTPSTVANGVVNKNYLYNQ